MVKQFRRVFIDPLTGFAIRLEPVLHTSTKYWDLYPPFHGNKLEGNLWDK